MNLHTEDSSADRPRRRKTPSLTGMKMVTIEKIDDNYIARPHTVRQYRKRRVTFYNSSSSTIELDFSDGPRELEWPPFEENGPYVLTGGELLTLRLKSARSIRGNYPYKIEELEREEEPEAVGENQFGGDNDEPQKQEAVQYRTMLLRRGGGSPQMIID